MSRAIVVVLDSFGIGCAPDAEKFGDAGADTFGHIAEYRHKQGKPLHLPNLTRWDCLKLIKRLRDFMPEVTNLPL